MSFDCVLLSPPQSSTTIVLPASENRRDSRGRNGCAIPLTLRQQARRRQNALGQPVQSRSYIALGAMVLEPQTPLSKDVGLLERKHSLVYNYVAFPTQVFVLAGAIFNPQVQ